MFYCVLHWPYLVTASHFIGGISFKIPFQTVPQVTSAQLSPRRRSLPFHYSILFPSFFLPFGLSLFVSTTLSVLFLKIVFIFSFCLFIIIFQPLFFLHTSPSFILLFLISFNPSLFPSLFYHSFYHCLCIAFVPMFSFLHLCFCQQDRQSEPVLNNLLFIAIEVTTGSHTYNHGQFQMLQLASPSSRQGWLGEKPEQPKWRTSKRCTGVD